MYDSIFSRIEINLYDYKCMLLVLHCSVLTINVCFFSFSFVLSYFFFNILA